jgi:glutathione S-transferase
MAEYQLYCFAQSGNCYKPALMLELAGAQWEPRVVDYFNGETRTPAYREVNEMGEAPVLVHGALRLSQSGVILDYLAERFARFAPRDAAERRECLRWLLFDNHKFTSYTATYRFMRALTANANAEVMGEFRRRAEAAWRVVDAHLRGRRYVVGDRLTYVDLSMCGYLFWPDEIGVDWDEYPGIRDWLDRIRAEPRWRAPYDLMPVPPGPAA